MSAIREAIGAQLRENLDREINIDIDGEGKPEPVIRLTLDSPPDYFLTFGQNRIAAARFRVEIAPANTDQSAVRVLDEMLSCGQGNGSSVVDALVGDGELEALGLSLDIEPGLYDAENVVADLIVTANVTVL